MNFKKLCLIATLLTQAVCMAQPTKIVVPFTAGGMADSVARIIEKSLSESLNRDFVVEYKTGAGGTIAARSVARSQTKETVLMVHSSAFVINSLSRDAEYNVLSDFEPVMLIGHVPMVAVVAPQSEFVTISNIKNTQRNLTIANGGMGTAGHAISEIFSKQLQTTVTHVPYRGETGAVADVISGSVDLAFVSANTVIGIKDKIRIMAVTGAQRNANLPGVPTFGELGITDLARSVNWIVLVANVTADPALLSQVKSSLSNQNNQLKFTALGLEIGSVEVVDFLKQEINKFDALQLKLR